MTWKSSVTKIAFKLHGWIGLLAGLFFLLYGITGSLLSCTTSALLGNPYLQISFIGRYGKRIPT
jgi:hypothetical protein